MSATLNIMATVNDTTGGVSISANKTIATDGTALDLRILEIGTSEEEVTISAEIGDCGFASMRGAQGAGRPREGRPASYPAAERTRSPMG